MRRLVILAVVALVVPVLSFAQTPAPTATEKAIRETDAANAKVAAAKSVEGVLAYHDDDAVMADASGATFRGTDPQAFRAVWERILAQPGVLIWTVERVVVVKPGQLAYTSGTWTNGSDKGRFLASWRLRPDGKWKVLSTTTWTNAGGR